MNTSRYLQRLAPCPSHASELRRSIASLAGSVVPWIGALSILMATSSDGVARQVETTCGQLAARTEPSTDASGNAFKLQILVQSGAGQRPLLADDTHIPFQPAIACLRGTVLFVVFPTISGHDLALAAFPNGELITISDEQFDVRGGALIVPSRLSFPVDVRDLVPEELRSWFDFNDPVRRRK